MKNPSLDPGRRCEQRTEHQHDPSPGIPLVRRREPQTAAVLLLKDAGSYLICSGSDKGEGRGTPLPQRWPYSGRQTCCHESLRSRSSDRRTSKRHACGYRAALDLVTTESWTDDDVVYYVEDDYLFTADALIALTDAVAALPEASYFSLYGPLADYDDPLERIEHAVPRDWKAQPNRCVGEQVWFNRASITSTFGARVGILREDLPIFIQCMRPFRHRLLDHETCIIYQGFVPYHGSEFFFGLPGDFELGLRGVARAVVLVPFRIALKLRARRQRTPHLLYTVTPNLATHLEHPVISPDRDWVAVAEEVAQWAEDNKMDAPSSAIRKRLSRVT